MLSFVAAHYPQWSHLLFSVSNYVCLHGPFFFHISFLSDHPIPVQFSHALAFLVLESHLLMQALARHRRKTRLSGKSPSIFMRLFCTFSLASTIAISIAALFSSCYALGLGSEAIAWHGEDFPELALAYHIHKKTYPAAFYYAVVFFVSAQWLALWNTTDMKTQLIYFKSSQRGRYRPLGLMIYSIVAFICRPFLDFFWELLRALIFFRWLSELGRFNAAMLMANCLIVKIIFCIFP